MAIKVHLLLLIIGAIVSKCYGNDQFTHIHAGPWKHVSAGSGYYWGVLTDDRIFRCDNPCTSWTNVPGTLIQIDVGDDEVWGVNSEQKIFKRPVDGGGAWTDVSGRLKHVSASGNGYIWGVNSGNELFKCKKPCTGNWIVVDGLLKQVDGGHKYVYGVNVHNDVYARPIDGSKYILADHGWRKIPGGMKMKHVTASGSDDIFGVTETNEIYRCPKPCTGEWERMQGSLSQVDATNNGLLGVNSVGALFFHNIES